MWIYNGEEFTEDMIGKYVGFVYIIENLTNNKKYIGKKQFRFKKIKSVKGKKKSIKVISDYMTYFGSNEELKNDVKLLGEDNFKRKILRLCNSLSEMSYFESKEIFLNGCLESDNWYNSWISVRINAKNLQKIIW